jgi:hypothetical protein
VNTKYETTFEKTIQQTAPMDAKIKTQLKETTYETDRRGTTDDAEMLADKTHQRGMYEAYKKEAAVSRTTTDDDLQNNNAQCRLMCGNSIPREFFNNQALPEVVINQTDHQLDWPLPGGPLCPMPPRRRRSLMCKRSCAKKT